MSTAIQIHKPTDNPYKRICEKGFNAAALKALASGKDRVCVMTEGVVRIATVTQRFDSHVLVTINDELYGMVF